MQQIQLRSMGGSLEDKAADAVAKAVASTLEKTLYGGKPGSKDEADRAEFFALVLSKTGDKFLSGAVGKQVVNKVVFGGLFLGVLLGIGTGWLIFHKRG